MSRFAPSSPVSLGPSAARALAANEDRLLARQASWSRTELAFSPAGSAYHGYPFLFLAAFPKAPEGRVATLALATRYFCDSLLVADSVMDGEYDGARLTHGALQLQVLQLEAYALLYELFPAGARFWPRFRTWTAAYVQACHEERQLAAPGARWRFDDDSARWMAVGKCGLAKISVAGLAELAEDPEPMEPICRAIDAYYVARQMIDDLSDWRVDLERGFPSLVLARVLDAVYDGDREAMAANDQRTARAIYLEGHADHTLHVGLRALDEAERHLAGLPALPFTGLLRTLRDQYEGVFAEIGAATCRRIHRSAVALPPPADGDPWSAPALAAVRLLLPRPDEGPGLSLLERAVRLEALAEADGRLAGALRTVVAGEGDQLIAHRLRSAPGGWRFTGAAPGLPPDLWHVAQVGLALERAGRRPEADDCISLATWAGRDGDPPGLWSIIGEPWRRPVGPEEAEVPDPVAIATWLRLLDARGTTVPAADAARRWLAARQEEGGSWRSSGASGPFLPTCAAVLALAGAGSEAPFGGLERARRFLEETQGEHGGWGGPRDEGEACSTALALLTLVVLQERVATPETAERAARGRRWLEGSGLLEDGVGGRTTRVLTASFLLRAALRWSPAAGRTATEPAAGKDAMEVSG